MQDRKTWAECWRCQHFVYECDQLTEDAQSAIGECDPKRIPHAPEVPFLQYGLYAAQISWWLAFFPPERFLILTQEEIQDPARALPVNFHIPSHALHNASVSKLLTFVLFHGLADSTPDVHHTILHCWSLTIDSLLSCFHSSDREERSKSTIKWYNERLNSSA